MGAAYFQGHNGTSPENTQTCTISKIQITENLEDSHCWGRGGGGALAPGSLLKYGGITIMVLVN